MSGRSARILVLEPVAAAGLELLEAAGFVVVRGEKLVQSHRQRELAEAEGLLVRSGTRIDAALLRSAPRLRAVARAGAGLDNVDVDAATRGGVAVLNAPGGNAVAAAELTFALLLALVRHVVAAHTSLGSGEWTRHRFVGSELAGKVLGVLGLGRIGALVASRGRAFEMQVVGCDPFVSDEHAESLGVRKMELEELLACADVVTLHLPLTEKTRGLLDARALSRMKPGAVLVNCARGGLLDEEALAAALEEERLAGAALDVYADEPPASSPLLALPNVVHTPHLGASTREAKEAVSLQIAKALRDYLLDGDLSGAVNLPYAVHDMGGLAPLLDLARRLGRMQAGLCEGAPSRVDVEVAADERLETGLLAQAFLCGLLEEACGEQVNVFNARYKASERGITVGEGRRPAIQGFPRLLATRVVGDGVVHAVDGGMLAPSMPRIVRVDGHWLDLEPAGRLLVLRNADVPGVLGKVGTLLGAHGINIGEMRLGRGQTAQQAISVWQVDEPVAETVLSALRGIEEVEDARQVVLGALAYRDRD